MASFDEDNIGKKLATTTAKSNKRKRNVEIKKVKDQNKLSVTFSKRKQGLFNKLIELSFLCEVKTALIIISPNRRKFYACGYPTPNTIVQHFLAEANSFSSKQQEKEEEKKVDIFEGVRVKYEDIQDELKEEKKKLQVLKEEQSLCCPYWWNHSIEDMSLECVEEFKTCLEHLKLNLVTNYATAAACPSFMFPTTTLSNNSLLKQCFLDQQENYDVAGTSSGFMVPTDFGHYY